MQFLWPDNFSSGWTEAVRLHDLLSALSVLTATVPNHVRRVAAPSWSSFLQILEDAGPPWIMAALHSSAAANVTTRADVKALLTVHDPGGNISETAPPWLQVPSSRRLPPFMRWRRTRPS